MNKPSSLLSSAPPEGRDDVARDPAALVQFAARAGVVIPAESPYLRPALTAGSHLWSWILRVNGALAAEDHVASLDSLPLEEVQCAFWLAASLQNMSALATATTGQEFEVIVEACEELLALVAAERDKAISPLEHVREPRSLAADKIGTSFDREMVLRSVLDTAQAALLLESKSAADQA